jgi:Coenzyme PQQ synthesis protein D (PqqD)
MPTAYVAKRDSVVCEKFDDEAVLINFETGTYFSLRGAAPEIWTLIQSANTVDRIAERLCAEGSGARDEIEATLAQLVAHSCVLICDIDDGDLSDISEPLASAKPFTPPVVQAFHDLQELIVVDPVHEVDAMDGWPNRPPPFGLGPNRP